MNSVRLAFALLPDEVRVSMSAFKAKPHTPPLKMSAFKAKPNALPLKMSAFKAKPNALPLAGRRGDLRADAGAKTALNHSITLIRCYAQ